MNNRWKIIPHFVDNISLRINQVLSDDRKREVLDELEIASSPGFDFFLLVILSCAIATFGLLTDSAAVIIGAMLVAPLMSPILGMSLASVAGESHMFRRAIITLAIGAALAIALSASITWILLKFPFGLLQELPDQVMSRTRPSPIDLGIALAGGAAAAYALANPRISAALPGVAIATALMPPLCTVGIGLALSDVKIEFGAMLLFLTNLVAISFAGIIVFVALGFRPSFPKQTWHGIPRSVFISAGLVLMITIPLVVISINFVRDLDLRRQTQEAVASEILTIPDAELVELTINGNDKELNLLITLRASRQPGYEEVLELQKSLAVRLQRTVSLKLIIIPTTRLDPLIPPTPTPTATPGPSSTPTMTPTITPTPTATQTSTPLPTYSLTPTNTPTVAPTFTPSPTSTPMSAIIYFTGGKGVTLRESPNGKVIVYLPDGTEVKVLEGRDWQKGLLWVQVRDLKGRIGWVLGQFVSIHP